MIATPDKGAPGSPAPSGDDRIFRVAVLASGSGSNLQAIIDRLHHPPFTIVDTEAEQAPQDQAVQAPQGQAAKAPPPAAAAGGGGAPTPRIEIVLVVCDVPGAKALERAERAGIRTALIPVRDFRDREEHDLALATRLCEAEPDLVVLAGYMRLVSPSLLTAFPWRVINLHPALLPAFPGTTSIRDAVRYGVKVTGVTVHFVDVGVDTGPVIAQEAVRVKDGDTPDSLGARIHAVEHRLLPEVVRLIAAGKVHPPLPGSRVVQVDWEAD